MDTTAKTLFTLASLVQSYADYNAWANQKLTGFLQTKPTALLDAEVPSSFPTIRLTLAHNLEVQHFWLSVINGTQDDPNPQRPSDIQGLMEVINRNSEEIAEYTRSLANDELQQNCYLKTPWFEADKSRLEYLVHTFNHSAYHRGQIVTMGRQLGFADAPMTDYIYYILRGK